MNKTATIILVTLLVIVGGYFVLRKDTANVPVPNKQNNVPELATYSDPSGLTFEYRTGQNGYVIDEVFPSGNTSNSTTFLRSINLMQAEDASNEPPVGGEGPQMISVHIYQNTKNQSASVWAQANPNSSFINQKLGETKETVVGGANAVRYMADGLYAADVVVIAHGGFIYVMQGMFIDESSQIRKDFEPFLASVKFVQTPEQQ